MRLFSIQNLRTDAAKYPDANSQIEDWYQVAKREAWKNLEEVKQVYRDTEAVGKLTVFNIKGNAYRLIVGISYKKQVISGLFHSD